MYIHKEQTKKKYIKKVFTMPIWNPAITLFPSDLVYASTSPCAYPSAATTTGVRVSMHSSFGVDKKTCR